MSWADGPAVSAFELLVLDQLPDVGPVTVRRLLDRFGTAERALVARQRDFAEVAGRAAAGARRDPAIRARVREALERASDRGMTVLTWDDSKYPGALRHLTDPPPVLFLCGRPELLAHAPMITIVGARRATARARSVCERLAAALGRAGVCVTSGLALGVDGAAHSGALRVRGDTLAVLGAGPDVAYPRIHRRLHDRIAERGLLVSEFLPGTKAAPHHFPRRNRILAALSSATVVVEAGRRSGSLITVDHALDLGKDVWAVPGPIDASACAGSNRMLADGARPLVSVDDFVAWAVAGVGGTDAHRGFFDGRKAGDPTIGGSEADGPGPAAATGVTGAASPPPAGPAGARTLEDRILGALAEQPVPADELAARFDAPIATILAVLTTLELYGEVERVSGMRFRRAA